MEHKHIPSSAASPSFLFSVKVQPAMIVSVGTRMSEALVQLFLERQKIPLPVPSRLLHIDSLPYAHVVNMLIKAECSANLVCQALPENHYFPLTTMIGEGFDFAAPLNAEWQEVFFNPQLRQLAHNPNAPGCAGIPLFGRARVENNVEDIHAFFTAYSDEMIAASPETLALHSGVQAFLLTTFAGGTGTGTILHLGVLLRSALPEGSTIHLLVAMPCVFRGDKRAMANAAARLRELQHCHREGASIRFKDGRELPPPFETVMLLYDSDGRVRLRPQDAVQFMVNSILPYLHPRTQGVIASEEVNLTDVSRWDDDGNPTPVRIIRTLTVRAKPPEQDEFMALTVLEYSLQNALDRFDRYGETKALVGEEQSRVRAVVERVSKDYLDRPGLLARIETPSSREQLRNAIERFRSTIPMQSAEQLKITVLQLVEQTKRALDGYVVEERKKTRQLAPQLTQEIQAEVESSLGATPHLCLATVAQLQAQAQGLAAEARSEIGAAEQQRKTVSGQIGEAIKALQAVTGLSAHKRNERARVIANRICDLVLVAAHTRRLLDPIGLLAELLSEGISGRGLQTPEPTVPSLCQVFQETQQCSVGPVRSRLVTLRAHVDQKKLTLAQQWQKSQSIFCRSLLNDNVPSAQVEAQVKEWCDAQPGLLSPVVEVLAGRKDLREAVPEVIPLLPGYAANARALPKLVQEDADASDRLLTMLRDGVRSFTPQDPVVLEQQGLRNPHLRRELGIFEVPGGEDGPLGQLFHQGGIVSSHVRIVATEHDEIRFYSFTDGYPYYAIKPAHQQYEAEYRRYNQQLGRITPLYSHDKPGPSNVRYARKQN